MNHSLYNSFFTAMRYRWIVWSILVVTYMISFFHRMSVSVVKDTLSLQFGMTATEFGTMASMYFYAYCIAQIPSGVLADSIGVRRTAFMSMTIAAVATMAFGYASSLPALYISRFAVGIGVAASFVCVMKVQSQWFKEREFSTLSGICLFGGNLGSLFAQAPLAFLVVSLSFQGAFLGIGLCTLLLGFLCLLLVRNKPQDMGFAPINPAPVATTGEQPPLGRVLVDVLTNKSLIPLYIFYFFFIPQFLAFGGTWSVTYIRDIYGLALVPASNMASLQVIGFMCGSLILGFVSDRAGRRKPFLILPCFVGGVVWAILALAGGVSLPITVFAICLFSAGFCTGAFSVMMAMCKEHSPRESTGTAIAVLNTFGFLGIALATPSYGYILDFFAGSEIGIRHGHALTFLALITAAGFTAVLFVKESFRGNVHARTTPTNKTV